MEVSELTLLHTVLYSFLQKLYGFYDPRFTG